MKTLIGMLAFVFATALPLAGQIQADKQPNDKARQRLEEISKRLSLTPEQVEQLRPVLTEEVRKLKALQEKYGSGRASRRSRINMARELRDIRSETDEHLSRILSKEQMSEMKKIREEWKQEFRDRAGK